MKYDIELIKNIEFVFDEEYGKKIIIIPYNLIACIYFETVFPEVCDYLNNPDDDHYYIYDLSGTKEYIIKYIGAISIKKEISDYVLDIEAIKYLTDIKKLINLSHIIFNYNNNTKTIYKNIIQVFDDEDNYKYNEEDKYELPSTFDEDNYELPSVLDVGPLINLSFVYDCGTYKRVDTPNE